MVKEMLVLSVIINISCFIRSAEGGNTEMTMVSSGVVASDFVHQSSLFTPMVTAEAATSSSSLPASPPPGEEHRGPVSVPEPWCLGGGESDARHSAVTTYVVR